MTHGMQHRVEEQPYDDAHNHLEQHNRKQPPHGLLVGEKDRHHLVRGRENHGNKRSRSNNPTREERGRHGREATLRDGSEKGAHNGTCVPGSRNKTLHTTLG